MRRKRGFRPHHFRHYVGRRLHRRIFVWFGASILLTGIAVSAIMAVLHDSEGWHREVRRVERFVGHRFEEVWDDPVRRDALARSMADDLALSISVRDAAGDVLFARDPKERCHGPHMMVPVDRSGNRIGSLDLCAERHTNGAGWKVIIPIIVAGLVLWAASGRIARRLTRPLVDLVRVTEEIGQGKLSARAPVGCHTADEVGVLACSINEMAGRIERQLNDQRVLLAAVSHELRTPLGHLRILTELARQQGATEKVLDDLESEVVEIDRLVGELLASSRLDFTALSPQKLDAADVSKRALERAGLDPTLLESDGAPIHFNADPTLIARALANLIDNAMKHGGGVSKLRVRTNAGRLMFVVEDRGPGLRPGDEVKVFEPFYRRDDGSGTKGSLGLGLALVQRIAEAHGGRAWAENKSEGGARVTFELSAA
jgi:two-component system, OmpR family, sensor kinase